jgi:hypothetical protein
MNFMCPSSRTVSRIGFTEKSNGSEISVMEDEEVEDGEKSLALSLL